MAGDGADGDCESQSSFADVVTRAFGAEDRSFAAGAGVLAVAMGFGRFAYTPLLVIMQRDAGLTVALSGVLASVNLAGYLAGALIAMHRGVRTHRYGVLCAGAAIVVVTTAMMALPAPWWLAARFTTGVASGLVFVLTVSLFLDRGSRTGSTAGLDVLFSGVGLGIAAAGVLVPVIARYGGSRITWIGIGLACAAVLLIALPHVGDEPLAPAAPASSRARENGPFWWLAFAYGLEGAAYIIPATFLVAMVNEVPALERFSSMTWVLVGVVATPAAMLWGRAARRLGKGETVVVAMIAQALGLVAPLIVSGLAGVLIVAVSLGITFVGITAVTSALARELRPRTTNVAIGVLTGVYGVGQIAGPLIAVRVSLATGRYRDGLLAAACLLMLGILVFGGRVVRDRSLRAR